MVAGPNYYVGAQHRSSQEHGTSGRSFGSPLDVRVLPTTNLLHLLVDPQDSHPLSSDK